MPKLHSGNCGGWPDISANQGTFFNRIRIFKSRIPYGRRNMMTLSRILKITSSLSLGLQLGLSVWGQQSASSATAAATASSEKPQIHDSGQAPHFEFDRPAERVTFRNGDVQLKGVLVKPDGPGPFPAVIFVHGSGPATHDEPAFVVHANTFLRQGFAVLSYDKRGSGESTGNLEISDYDDLAHDVSSAVSYLRTRSEIAPSKIGLLGRGEGGWVGTLAASHDPEISFVVMSSGCAVGPYEETLYWTRTALRVKGVPDTRIEEAVKLKSDIWGFYRQVAQGKIDHSAQRRDLASLQQRFAQFADLHPELPPGIMDPDIEDPRKFSAFTHMIYYDPAPALSAVHAPLLEAIGANDEAVEPSSTLAVLGRLRTSGHDVTAQIFPGVGHSLLKMDGPRILGYADGYLDYVVLWAKDQVKR
jgi:uncharacterized protein